VRICKKVRVIGDRGVGVNKTMGSSIGPGHRPLGPVSRRPREDVMAV
jgi:hypothetical protein